MTISTKHRQIKIKMNNQNDKDLVMSNFNKLLQASEKLRKVSVTDDYQRTRRNQKKVEESKSKTER